MTRLSRFFLRLAARLDPRLCDAEAGLDVLAAIAVARGGGR